MASLFDTLKQTLSEAPPALQPQQSQIQKAFAAKSGKAAVGAGAPKASSLGEANAMATTQAGLGQAQMQGQQIASDLQGQQTNLAAQGTLANQALASEARQSANTLTTQAVTAREGMATKDQVATSSIQAGERIKTDQLNNAASMKLREYATQRNIETDNLFADFENNNKELASRRDGAELEQLGFLLAMNDKAYLDELDRVGRERSLRNEVSFREELGRVVWGEQLSQQLAKMQFESGFNAQGRDDSKLLASINIDAAMALARAAIEDGNRQAIAQGAVDTGKEGLDAWAKYEKANPPPPPGGNQNNTPVAI